MMQSELEDAKLEKEELALDKEEAEAKLADLRAQVVSGAKAEQLLKEKLASLEAALVRLLFEALTVAANVRSVSRLQRLRRRRLLLL